MLIHCKLSRSAFLSQSAIDLTTFIRGQNLNLAERVARLEQAVFSHQEPRPSTARGQPASKATRPTQNGSSLPVNHDEEQQKTSQWLEGLLTEVLAPQANPRFESSLLTVIVM